jgi:hypothetical protein
VKALKRATGNQNEKYWSVEGATFDICITTSYLLTYLLVLFVPTGTQGLNFTIVEVSIAVKFFTETGLLALCYNSQPGGVPEYPF